MRHKHRMYFKHINLKNLFCLITILACFMGMFKFMPLTTVDANNEKIVRVGYYEKPSFQSGTSDDVPKGGYAYDYLQRIKLYNDWRYEYVYDSYEALRERLENGSIDLLAGVSYTPEEAAKVRYPKSPMGSTEYYLFKRSTNYAVNANPATINGTRIGVIKGAQVEVIERYLQSNNIVARLVEFNDVETAAAAVLAGEIDIISMAADTVFSSNDLEVFADIGASDYYLAVNKQRLDLLDDVNSAQQLLKQEDPHFRYDLTQIWSRDFVLNSSLLPHERGWLANHDTFTIGYLDDCLPYGDQDEDGNTIGLVTDIVPEIFKVLGYSDIKLEYKAYANSQAMVAGLLNHEVDVVFPGVSNSWIMEQYNLIPSESVVKSSFYILYNGEYPDMSRARIAVSRHNSIMDPFRRLFYPDNEVVFCDDIDECISAIRMGHADVVIVSGLRAEYLMRSKESCEDLNLAQLADGVAIGFAGLNENADIIRIINHGLSLMDKNFSLNHAYHYMPNQEVTALGFFKKNIWLPVGGIILFFVIIVYFIARENKKNREHLDESEMHRRELSDKVEEISLLNTELQERQNRLEQFAADTETHLLEMQVLNDLLQEQQTKLEESVEAAEAANNAKSTFLFNMSHDIRTPLNAIIGFTELAERDSENVEKNNEYRQKIKSASHQLLDILNNVLEMARIENKDMLITEEMTDIVELFNSCLAMFEGELDGKHLRLESSIDIKHQYLYVDSTHMSEVVINIISNAVKYTPDGGSVFVEVKELAGNTEEECTLKIIVRDTGIGMSEKFIHEIFEQFSRDRNSTQSGITGTGLGMAIVKTLVDKMKGTIDVHSKLGEGTEIVICTSHKIGVMPSIDTTDAGENGSVDFTGKRLLLAEDNDLNAEIAIFVLEDAGFEVERAEDGVKCFDMIVKHEAGYYDLILMDIQMPNLDGYGATEKIRQLDDEAKANIPIVALTANAFKEDQEKAFSVGMNAHLAKPIDVEKTLSTLCDILK
ncbi:ATP-binding protein [Anaerovibrio lipolyticus]|uniref:ATP-binding protein n=1 Tax=Anaerovibrio lipolyticus TaxID=82374 RepID=UPI000481184D|nr:transporter substrate-binding domain-containing protein [Anaerovibrio lipolyticus]